MLSKITTFQWRPFDLALVDGPLAHRVRAVDRQEGSAWFLCRRYVAVDLGKLRRPPRESKACSGCHRLWMTLNRRSFGAESPTCYEIREVAGLGTSLCPSSCAWVAEAPQLAMCIGGLRNDASAHFAIQRALQLSRPEVSIGVDAPPPPSLDDTENRWGHFRSLDDVNRRR